MWYHASWRDDSGTVRTESVCTIVDWSLEACHPRIGRGISGRLSLDGRNSPIQLPGLKSQKEMWRSRPRDGNLCGQRQSSRDLSESEYTSQRGRAERPRPGERWSDADAIGREDRQSWTRTIAQDSKDLDNQSRISRPRGIEAWRGRPGPVDKVPSLPYQVEGQEAREGQGLGFLRRRPAVPFMVE